MIVMLKKINVFNSLRKQNMRKNTWILKKAKICWISFKKLTKDLRKNSF